MRSISIKTKGAGNNVRDGVLCFKFSGMGFCNLCPTQISTAKLYVLTDTLHDLPTTCFVGSCDMWWCLRTSKLLLRDVTDPVLSTCIPPALANLWSQLNKDMGHWNIMLPWGLEPFSVRLILHGQDVLLRGILPYKLSLWRKQWTYYWCTRNLPTTANGPRQAQRLALDLLTHNSDQKRTWISLEG
jgi:hypothetical protein